MSRDGLNPSDFTLLSQHFSAVFLDMGDTLVETYPGTLPLYQQAFAIGGFNFEQEKLQQAVSTAWAQVETEDYHLPFEPTPTASLAWQRRVEERVFNALAIPASQRDSLFNTIVATFENPAAYRLFPEVPQVLATLKNAGLKLAMISNWSWKLPELCATLGIADYFDLIVSSARVGFSKPQPGIFNYALHHLQLDSAQVVHIGDNWQADVVGAQQVGITPLWLTRPTEQPGFKTILTNSAARDGVTRLQNLHELAAINWQQLKQTPVHPQLG